MMMMVVMIVCMMIIMIVVIIKIIMMMVTVVMMMMLMHVMIMMVVMTLCGRPLVEEKLVLELEAMDRIKKAQVEVSNMVVFRFWFWLVSYLFL